MGVAYSGRVRDEPIIFWIRTHGVIRPAPSLTLLKESACSCPAESETRQKPIRSVVLLTLLLKAPVGSKVFYQLFSEVGHAFGYIPRDKTRYLSVVPTEIEEFIFSRISPFHATRRSPSVPSALQHDRTVNITRHLRIETGRLAVIWMPLQGLCWLVCCRQGFSLLARDHGEKEEEESFELRNQDEHTHTGRVCRQN